MTSHPRQSKPEEPVMAGDGGRVPDVSEQRAESHDASVRILYRNWRGETAWRHVLPHAIRLDATEWHPREQWLLDAYDVDKRAKRSFALADVLAWSPKQPDPASVLAALLAEQPDATITALETLLTSDEAHIAAAAVVGARERLSPTGIRALDTSEAALRAACRSLRPKAPKEDR